MKRLGLSRHLPSATLFLTALGASCAWAQEKTPAPPAAAASRFDKDGDGFLDDVERAAAREALMKEPAAASKSKRTTAAVKTTEPEATRSRLLQLFDENKDGHLDEAERAKAFEAAGKRGGKMRDELMKRFDRNGDGTLDEEERAAAFKAIEQRRGGRSPAVQRVEDEKSVLQRAVRAAIESDAAQLKRFDRDGNGKIDDGEWDTARIQIAGALQEVPAAPSTATPGKRGPQRDKALMLLEAPK